MKCSECGGIVLCNVYTVYYADGSTAGNYECQNCGRKKEWFNKGVKIL